MKNKIAMVTVTAKLPVAQIVHGNGRLIQRCIKLLQDQSKEPVDADRLVVTQTDGQHGPCIEFTYTYENVAPKRLSRKYTLSKEKLEAVLSPKEIPPIDMLERQARVSMDRSISRTLKKNRKLNKVKL